MVQVSIGQVENLADLVSGLQSMREALESSCHAQITVAENKWAEACKETQDSECMLQSAIQEEQARQQAFEDARQNLDSNQHAFDVAQSELSGCVAQPRDKDGTPPDCSTEYASAEEAASAVAQAEAALVQAQAGLEQATANRQMMEQRVELVRQAQALAEQARVQVQQACSVSLASVDRAVQLGTARLASAQQALNAYLATNPSAMQFHDWLKWNPAQHGRRFITPDILRDRMNLSPEQRTLLQEYLYERNPAYRKLVDKYRSQWANAKGDVERNIIARKVRIHLSGEFGEQVVRHAFAPLGARIETQGRTFVGDSGRYTKTDLIVTGLHVPVVLGRGEGMGAAVGGSMAFEVKCGKADYLYSQKEHMVFQANGHKHADAQCTLCSRDIHDLSPEKERELRNTLHEAGSPLVGMLPGKNEIDHSCLEFIRNEEEQEL